MQWINRISLRSESIKQDAVIPSGLYVAKVLERLPDQLFSVGDAMVRGKTPKWTTGKYSIAFDGDLLSDDIRSRFRFLAESAEESPERFYRGELSSLFFFKDLEDLELNEFELVLHSDLFHLEEVCYRPTLDLKLTEYKTPVSRARRVSRKAVSHLAAHSEDWHSQTFVGVKPARVIALHREDFWNTYENVATKNLIDYLRIYLSRRLNSLNEIDSAFEELIKLYRTRKNSHVTENYMRILGKHFAGNVDAGAEMASEQDVLQKTRTVIEQMLIKVRGLMSSQLYRKVSNKKVPLQLQMTNVLISHQHYRYVAVFWNLWLKNTDGVRSDVEVMAEQQKLNHDLELYALHLILNSLAELSFTYESKSVGTHRFSRNNRDELVIDTSRPGGFELTLNGAQPLQFTTLPVDVRTCEDFKWPTVNGNTVLLYPTSNGSLDFSNVDWFKFDARKEGQLLQVPISTLSVYSQEQVTNILNRWLIQPSFEKYPAEVSKVPTDVLEFIRSSEKLSKSISIRENSAIIVKFYDGFSHEWEQYLKGHRSHGKKQASVKNTIDAFEEGFRLINYVTSCPKCQTSGQEVIFDPNGKEGTFRCQCYTCSTTWGKDTTKAFLHLSGELCDDPSFQNLARYDIG